MNYHELQKPIETNYHRQLERCFAALFESLSKIPLDQFMIKHVFNSWYATNERYLREITAENIYEANAIANEVIFSVHNHEELQHRLSNANMALIDAELRILKDKIDILAVQIAAYGLSRPVINDRLHEITHACMRSLELLAVNTTILNTRQIIFNNALESGYTQYLGETQKDDRVREEHYATYQDQWILFSNPPAIGHVGTQINCRCYAKQFK